MNRELLACRIKSQTIARKFPEVYWGWGVGMGSRVGPVVALMRKTVLYRKEAAWLDEHFGVAIV